MTNAEAWFSNSLRPRKPEGSLSEKQKLIIYAIPGQPTGLCIALIASTQFHACKKLYKHTQPFKHFLLCTAQTCTHSLSLCPKNNNYKTKFFSPFYYFSVSLKKPVSVPSSHFPPIQVHMVVYISHGLQHFETIVLFSYFLLHTYIYPLSITSHKQFLNTLCNLKFSL